MRQNTHRQANEFSLQCITFVGEFDGLLLLSGQQDDVFKPFLEIRDLTTGDGLGLPICRQMAQNMNGDLSIDSQFTKGARFVMDLNV